MTWKLNRRELAIATASSTLLPRVNVAARTNGEQQNHDASVTRLADRIMDSSPENVVGMVVGELSAGTSPQMLLAAEFNAGARYHGHHSAFVAQPIAAVAKRLPPTDRLLPLFYYLSVLRFRNSQPRLAQLDDSKLPSPAKAGMLFAEAMESGDRDDAERALISISREHGPKLAYDQLWTYGAERNSASGGHTAVAIANTYRTMQDTGWACSETALRFAVGNAAASPPKENAVCRVNLMRSNQVARLPAAWHGAADESATLDLVDLYRTGKSGEACQTTFEMIRDGQVSAASVWDAAYLTTAELIVRYKWVGQKMLAGHSVTCVNALRYMSESTSSPQKQIYALLEAVEWTTSFLWRERARPALRDWKITGLESTGLEPRQIDSQSSLDRIFQLLPPRRFASMSRPGFDDVDTAMEMTFAWALANRDRGSFLDRAAALICSKSTEEVHDFKFPMALFENCQYASPRWHPHLLAASLHVLQGTEMEDSAMVSEARRRLEL